MDILISTDPIRLKHIDSFEKYSCEILISLRISNIREEIEAGDQKVFILWRDHLQTEVKFWHLNLFGRSFGWW